MRVEHKAVNDQDAVRHLVEVKHAAAAATHFPLDKESHAACMIVADIHGALLEVEIKLHVSKFLHFLPLRHISIVIHKSQTTLSKTTSICVFLELVQ